MTLFHLWVSLVTLELTADSWEILEAKTPPRCQHCRCLSVAAYSMSLNPIHSVPITEMVAVIFPQPGGTSEDRVMPWISARTGTENCFSAHRGHLYRRMRGASTVLRTWHSTTLDILPCILHIWRIVLIKPIEQLDSIRWKSGALETILNIPYTKIRSQLCHYGGYSYSAI